jgi:CheY-like chemotaxis protein
MSKKRVLIVDDEAVVVRVLKLVLERSGYEVESRPDGQAALERILEPRSCASRSTSASRTGTTLSS